MKIDLPTIPIPWSRPAATSAGARVRITHFTDPLCPWAYSFEPVLRALEARYGDQLEFRTVLIGLVENVEESLERGSSAEGRALTALRFRRYGMPIAAHVRPRVIASGPACRFVKAAELQSSAAGDAALRLLRLAWYTTPLLLDTGAALAEIAGQIQGLDTERVLADLYGDAADAAYRADRDEARQPSPIAVALRRTARSDGRERYTAPTLLLHADDGRTAVVPGFQPYEAADVALMNLEARLERLPVPDLTDLLRGHPGGLTSAEVARTLADTTSTPDRYAAEAALVRLVAAGTARRTALGDDALWTLNPPRSTQ